MIGNCRENDGFMPFYKYLLKKHLYLLFYDKYLFIFAY